MRNNKTILAVDIGNTNINIGLFKAGSLKVGLKVSSQLPRRELKRRLLSFVSVRGKISKGIERIVVCSVVPHLNRTLDSILKEIFGKNALFCGRDFTIPVKNLYKSPESVGQDRLVNAYAALQLYGRPLIIIDFGTAITFDCLNKKGEYRGGIIVPGLKLSLEALARGAALLPMLPLAKRGTNLSLIGRTTKESMYSGLFFGFSAMVECLTNRLKKEAGRKVKVILTGGDTKIMRSFLKKYVDIIDEDLALKGLYLLSRDI